MIRVHCVDMTGSMSNQQVLAAQARVKHNFQPSDLVVVYDSGYKVVTDLDKDFTTYRWDINGNNCGPQSTLRFLSNLGDHQSILYSDGLLVEGELEKFTFYVEIEYKE